MRSRVYQINIHSQLRFLVALIGTFLLSVFFIKMILPKLSNDYKNRSSDSETKLIKEGKSIYASKMFNLFLYFLSIGFLVLFLNKMFYPKSSISWASLSLIGSFVFYYWIMKSKKKQNESRLILLISINELVFCRLGCACFV